MADASFTGFSATLGRDATTPTGSGSIPKLGLTQQDYHVASALRRVGARKLHRLLNDLTGSVIGGTVVENRAQVLAVNSTFALGEFGGVRTVENVSLLNRPTDQTDVDNINEILARSRPRQAEMRPYGEDPRDYNGSRVIRPYDALMGTDETDPLTFILGESYMVRIP